MIHRTINQLCLVILMLALVHVVLGKEINSTQDLNKEETRGYETPWEDAGSRSSSKSFSSSSSKSHGEGDGKGVGYGASKKKPKGHYVVGVPEEEFNKQEAAKKKHHDGGSYGYEKPSSEEYGYSQGYGHGTGGSSGSGYDKQPSYGAQQGAGQGGGYGQGYGKSQGGKPYVVAAYVEEDSDDSGPYDDYNHKRAPVSSSSPDTYSPAAKEKPESAHRDHTSYQSYQQPNPEMVNFQYPPQQDGYSTLHHHQQDSGVTGYRSKSSSPEHGHHSEQWFHQDPNYHYKEVRSYGSDHASAQGRDDKQDKYQQRQGQLDQGKDKYVSVFVRHLGHGSSQAQKAHGNVYGASESQNSGGIEKKGYLLLPVVPNDSSEEHEAKQYGLNEANVHRGQKAYSYDSNAQPEPSYTDNYSVDYNDAKDGPSKSQAYKQETPGSFFTSFSTLGQTGYATANDGYNGGNDKAYRGQEASSKDSEKGYQNVQSYESTPEKDTYKNNKHQNTAQNDDSYEKPTYQENGYGTEVADKELYDIPLPPLTGNIDLEYGFTPFVEKANGLYDLAEKGGYQENHGKIQESYKPPSRPIESYQTFKNAHKQQTTHVIHNKPEIHNVLVDDLNLQNFGIPLKTLDPIIPEKLLKEINVPHPVQEPGFVPLLGNIHNKQVITHEPYGLSVSYQNVGNGFLPIGGLSFLNGGQGARFFHFPQAHAAPAPAHAPQYRAPNRKTKSVAIFMQKSPQFRHPSGFHPILPRNPTNPIHGLNYGEPRNYRNAHKELIPQQYLHGLNFMGPTILPFGFP